MGKFILAIAIFALSSAIIYSVFNWNEIKYQADVGVEKMKGWVEYGEKTAPRLLSDLDAREKATPVPMAGLTPEPDTVSQQRWSDRSLTFAQEPTVDAGERATPVPMAELTPEPDTVSQQRWSKRSVTFTEEPTIPPTLRHTIVIATPTTRPTPTAAPVPTPTFTSEELLAQWRAYLLGLVNGSRKEAGLPAVALGNNEAAQKHAESMLEHGFTGHWGLDGFTPYMRYTVAGGTNYMKENTSGVTGVKNSDWGPQYRKLGWRASLAKTHHGLLDSPGHRKTILGKWHKTVGLGIACNDYTCSVVQNFDGDYVEFTSPPSISRAGVLTFAGKFKGGFTMSDVHLWYHQTPHELTLGQLDAAYSYNMGQEPATFIVKPAPPGSYYSASDLIPANYRWLNVVDPYFVKPNAARRSGIRLVTPLEYRAKAVPWTVADKWPAQEDSSFNVEANIRDILSDMGHGVYIAIIWGTKGGEKVPLTNYAIFVD